MLQIAADEICGKARAESSNRVSLIASHLPVPCGRLGPCTLTTRLCEIRDSAMLCTGAADSGLSGHRRSLYTVSGLMRRGGNFFPVDLEISGRSLAGPIAPDD